MGGRAFLHTFYSTPQWMWFPRLLLHSLRSSLVLEYKAFPLCSVTGIFCRRIRGLRYSLLFPCMTLGLIRTGLNLGAKLLISPLVCKRLFDKMKSLTLFCTGFFQIPSKNLFCCQVSCGYVISFYLLACCLRCFCLLLCRNIC